MDKLLEFIHQFNKDLGIDLPLGWQKLSKLEIARRFIQGLNRYFFQTHQGIGRDGRLGEEFEYFSEFHKFWKTNHRSLLNPLINTKQVKKAASSLSRAMQKHSRSILSLKQDTCGIPLKAVAQVRFFTANQDFRKPPEDSYRKYLRNPDAFDHKTIAESPVEFLGFLGMTRLSQTDKRLDFARNAARFLDKNNISAFEIAQMYENDALRIREGLTNSQNMGYGSKKANMFIRDMVDLKVWPDLGNFDAIDVASDINTMKLALRTRILETEIPLVSSLMDIFCYQYELMDAMCARAWRSVWTEWKALDEDAPISPCLMDSLLYRLGREYCRDNLVRFRCLDGHEGYNFGARIQKCRQCKKPLAPIARRLPCQVDAKDLPRVKGILDLPEDNLLAVFDGTCVFEDVCLPKSPFFLQFDPPKSISIKGETGWTSAYSDVKKGGGGLMS